MRARFVLAAVLLSAPTLVAQEPVDRAMIARIRAEGLERSQVQRMFDTLTTVIGPRLTGSAAYLRAANYAKQKLAEFGASGSRLESWPFGRGWELERFVFEMIEPRYMPLLGFPQAWSAPTPGEIVATPVLTAGKSVAEVERSAAQLRNGILVSSGLRTDFVLSDRIQPTDSGQPEAPAPTTWRNFCAQTPPAAAGGGGRAGGGRAGGPSDQQRINQIVADAQPAVRLSTSGGRHGSLFLQGGSYRVRATSANIVVAAEHYNMIVGLLNNGVPVKLRVNSQVRFTTDTNGYNVIAEIPGTDPRLRDEIVMAGAHLDSWHSSLGAADNADASAVMLEVVRILRAVGAQPRRTIRIALWGGEEQGLLGSCAWTRQHLADPAAREKMSMYLNMDPGTGPIYGFYMEGNTAAKAIFDAWLEPFRDLGYRRNLIAGIGNTDHLSFIAQGVPGFNPVQDFVDYDTRIHHTNWDSPERVPVQDLKSASVIYASMLYHAAMRDQRMPRR